MKKVDFNVIPDMHNAQSFKQATPLPVSSSDILKHIKKLDAELSFFSFHREVLIGYLPFSLAKDLLTEKFLEEFDENSWRQKVTVEEALAEAKEYSRFGWGKIIDHRGISTSRTIDKMKSWMFLLGDTEMIRLCETESAYMPYGAPILYKICKKYGWDIPEFDTGTVGSGTVGNMIRGLPCSTSCSECIH